MTSIRRKRVEITTFERERIVRQLVTLRCPVCHLRSELLTAQQAAALVQVTVESIRRWLVQGKAHGVKTTGGQMRICRESLILDTNYPSQVFDQDDSAG